MPTNRLVVRLATPVFDICATTASETASGGCESRHGTLSTLQLTNNRTREQLSRRANFGNHLDEIINLSTAFVYKGDRMDDRSDGIEFPFNSNYSYSYFSFARV